MTWATVEPGSDAAQATVKARQDANQQAPAVALENAHAAFKRWLGDAYDTDALDAVLATAACEQLDGDPVWLLVISGSGNAKTETVGSLAAIGATIVSTIASEGALLSGTSRKERSEDATGGLLRKMGDRGIIVIKDVTSILSMSGDQRASVLGAMREVYDGVWSRNVGTDGGQTLEWSGRLVIIGAVTTAWDKAHAVIASMGDRFVLVRMDSTTGRRSAGRQAIGNTGHEEQMRSELTESVATLMGTINTAGIAVTDAETDALLAAADLVTLARTAVERDYRGDVIDAHAPEMPTRFAKQLTQIVRGSVAIGIDRTAALRLAIRCARDSMPPIRLRIIDDVSANPDSSTSDVRKRLGMPRATVDRELQALHMLNVLSVDESEGNNAGRDVTIWRYTLRDDIEPDALDPKKAVPDSAPPTQHPENSVPETAVPTQPLDKGHGGLRVPTAKSGTETGQPACRVCAAPLFAPQSKAIGICGKTDAAHTDARAAA
ncbi:hypothetical protein [Cryobacterium tagatosivorans]|uniref:hypothetical protein n=1 Tax=Cryobacterium tagatosivorans TaxID=1259199 RepID=UPI0018E07D7E|nr:hypothetical protein [Cryobacterium tagatosivorans]